MLFKKHLLHKVLDGSKVQTRRRRTNKIRYKEGSIQSVHSNYTEKAQGHIKIDRRFEQRLADMTEEDAKAEGFNSLEEFLQEWQKIADAQIAKEEQTKQQKTQTIRA